MRLYRVDVSFEDSIETRDDVILVVAKNPEEAMDKIVFEYETPFRKVSYCEAVAVTRVDGYKIKAEKLGSKK